MKCKTQWHIIVAYLWKMKVWAPTFKLQSIDTEFGFIGSSREHRVRELARNDACIPKELIGKIEKKREGKYEFFRYCPQLNDRQRGRASSIIRRRCDGRTDIYCMTDDHQPWCAFEISVNNGGPLYNRCDYKPRKSRAQKPRTAPLPNNATKQLALL